MMGQSVAFPEAPARDLFFVLFFYRFAHFARPSISGFKLDQPLLATVAKLRHIVGLWFIEH